MSVLEKIYHSPVGKSVARKAGLADPPRLRRGDTLPEGPIVLAALSGASLARETLAAIGVEPQAPLVDEASAEAPVQYEGEIGGIVIDASTLTRVDELEGVRAALRPAVRALEGSGRVVLLGRPAAGDWEQHAVAQALDGIVRTVAKELRKGATANLVRAAEDADAGALSSTMAFLLSGRSAFVDGQVWNVGAHSVDADHEPQAPLTSRTVVVTGAARGIGAQIARVCAEKGAHVVVVDIPAAGESLAAVANEIGGSALQLDITQPDAGTAIAAHVARGGGKLYGIVHNAGITRDKMLVNTDADRWASVLKVNLQAEMAINEILLDPKTAGGLADGGRIVGVASTSGIAGNKGQTNYAASKAGVAGLVRAMAPDLADRGITVNAVAPGFIQTEMTAKIPFVQREIFQRSNSLSQGGLPEDVAQTIAYLLDPASGGLTGQVIRVCGQNLVGQ